MATKLTKEERRNRIIHFIQDNENPPTTEAIAQLLDLPVRTARHELKKMRDQNIVKRVNGWSIATQITQFNKHTKGTTMSSLLKKGETSLLTKEVAAAGGAPLTKILVGLGWDAATEGKDIDLDAMAFLIGSNGQLADQKGFVFFSNLNSADGSTVHSGDNLTGDGDGDDETITIDLTKVPAEVTDVVVAVYSYSGQLFSEVSNVVARIENVDGNTELARYEAGQLGDVKGIELGRIERDGSDWKFTATGTTTTDELAAFTKSYGYND